MNREALAKTNPRIDMSHARTTPKNLLRQRADALVLEHEAGTLTATALRGGLDELLEFMEPGPQDLLYLQTYSSSPDSDVIGMTLIEAGHVVPVALDSADWPYQKVLDAVMDGWRVISFPNMALLAVSPDQPHGLGFEFILERRSFRRDSREG